MTYEITPDNLSARKRAIRDLANRQAPDRDRWVARSSFYYEEDLRYMRFLVPEGLRVLDLGCGNGRLLAALNPSYGVGVDFSPNMIAIARGKYPHLEFYEGDVENSKLIAELSGPFDIIILSDTIGSLDDCQATLSQLQTLCNPDTRLIVAYYSRMWAPILGVVGDI